MPFSPSLLSAATVVLAVLMGFVLVALVVLWKRIHAFSPQALAQLLAELGERERAAAANPPAPADRAEAKPPEPKLAVPRPVRWTGSQQRVDPAEPTAVAGPTLIAIPNLASMASETGAAASEELSQRFGAIWAFADSGATAEAIAQRTGQPIGQVELILALRRPVAANDPGSRS